MLLLPLQSDIVLKACVFIPSLMMTWCVRIVTDCVIAGVSVEGDE